MYMTIFCIILACFIVIVSIVCAVFAVALFSTPTQRKPAAGVVVDNIEGESDGHKVWTPLAKFTDHYGRTQHGRLDFYQTPVRPLGSTIRVRFDPLHPTDVKQSARRLAVTLAVSFGSAGHSDPGFRRMQFLTTRSAAYRHPTTTPTQAAVTVVAN